MSTEKFREHPVHESLAGLKQSLSRDGIKLTEPADPDQLDRMETAAKYAERRLELAEPLLFNESGLNNLKKNLDTLKTELDTFRSNGNRDHLNSAAASVDGVVNQARNIVVFGPDEEGGASPSAEVERLREVGNALIERLRERISGLETQLDALKNNVSRLGKDIDDVKNSMNQRVKQFADEADRQKERIDGVVSDFQSQFSNAESRRQDENSERLTKQRERFDEFMTAAEKEKNTLVSDMNASFRELMSRIEKASQAIIETLKEKRDEASRLVQVVGNIGVTGNFQRIANDEQRQANIWRWIALGCMGLAALAVSTIVFNTIGSETFDWGPALFRLGVATIFLVPAWYAGKESAKHRGAAYRNRQAELELASIDPFLERLPEEKRNELKGNLTEKFFGNRLSEEKESDAVTAGPLYDIVKMAMKNLTSHR